MHVLIDISSVGNEKCWITFSRFSTASIQDLFAILSDSIKKLWHFYFFLLLFYPLRLQVLLWSRQCSDNSIFCKTLSNLIPTNWAINIFPKQWDYSKPLGKLGNCQLNEHDELSSSSSCCILATSNFLGSISHCPGIQNVALSSLWRIWAQLKCVQNAFEPFPAGLLMTGESLMTGVSWLFATSLCASQHQR